jgi:DNA-binding transcriptional LysR family regulator
MPPRTTLEQWLVLQTIVDSGGFHQAAEILHRSQSAISYAVARLQERLGFDLLQIEGRKATLTPLAKALLDDARPLIRQFEMLEARARVLSSGTEARIRLAVDSIYPKAELFAALKRFATGYPHTRVDLTEIIRLTPQRCQADIYIATQSRNPGDRLIEIELLAVARHDHPLHQLDLPHLCLQDLAHHLQVHLEDSHYHQLNDTVSAQQTWVVSSVEAAIEGVRAGLCFGWLPRHAIVDDLQRGTLRPLPLGNGQSRKIPLELVFADYHRAGEAMHHLAQLLLHPE